MRENLLRYDILIVFLLTGIWDISYAQLGSGPSGPITQSHGNPATSTCGGCHTGNSYTGTASFTVPATVPHSTTTTGQAFTFNKTTNATNGTEGWGFNIAIYNPSNTLVSDGYSNLSIHIYSGQTGGELQHFSKQTASTNPTFDWTAPSTLGSYTIYGCLNQVDGDGEGFDADDGPAVCTSTSFEVINNNPDAVNDSEANIPALSVFENSSTGSFNVLLNDQQTEGDTFVWNATNTAGLVGSLTDNSNGSFNYDPAGQFESLDTGETDTTDFTYTIRETGYITDYIDTATVTIEIKGVNDAPTAVDDGSASVPYVSVAEFGSVDNGTDGNGANNDLAANDSDPDTNDQNNNLQPTRTGCSIAVSGPDNGTLTNFDADGTFTYIHDGSDTTSDSFTYCTTDGTTVSTNNATVFIEITPVNDQPTIAGFSGSTAFSEQTGVIVDGSITLADSDSTTLNGAQVQITTNYVNGEDVLNCTTPLPAGIASCSFTAATGLLVLSGNASIANYESALENVTFFNSSDNPSQELRTISLTVQDNLNAFSSASTKSISPIIRLNDPPSISPIDDQVSTESTEASPNVFTVTAVASDVDVNDDSNTGDGSLTYSLEGAPVGMTISNTSPTQGQISWQPTQTGVFEKEYGPITVRVEDGDEDLSPPISVSFTITVSPPDGDLDDVADYNDLCLTVPDSTNADNDNDGTPGSDGGVNDGGDVCDLDDDNDGMPDLFEDSNGFDAFDASDAAADADGDGVSNLDEFNDGTNPQLANVTIDATGYFTPFSLPSPEPVDIHPDATLVTADNIGPFRPGRNSITWTAANSGNNNLGTTVQTLDVRPIVSFSPGQLVAEGSTATVKASLNGSAAVYPVTADYTVSGTADSSDHNAANGTLVFESPDTTATLSFDINADSLVENDESVIFTLTDVSNAVIGSGSRHVATIVEDNVLHQVELRFRQGGMPVSSAFVSEGPVTVEATVIDINTEQSHSIDWSATDNSLIPPTDFSTDSWTFIPVEGIYLVEVNVSDVEEVQLSNRISRVINIGSGPPTLTTENSDGIGDDDITEGLADSDDDGVPDYLDSVDGNAGGENILPNQTVSLEGQSFLETEAGLKLRLGTTAAAAGQFGVTVTDSDIEKFGSRSASAPLNAVDDFEHVGGVYDFEISGLVPGSSARIVVPLEIAIPLRSSYRKFHAATGWTDFVVDANNAIASAPGGQGACPQPGSDQYLNGLSYLDNCLQLTIEDGGLNDTDGLANGVIKDPGGIGLRLQDPEVPVVKEGGGRIHPLLIILFGIGIPVIIALRKKEEKH